MEQKELEFTKEMLERNDVLDNAVYKMCLTFLQFEDGENLDVKFPWDISILGEIRDLTVELLREKGYPVCDSCIVCDEPNRYCNLEECYMHSCNLHP
ncbi:hypothetical protein D3Z53_24770 [Lachnospiraceae bacterium]|nr:hypothetical protein [uncultured Schaedlerella sp.]NBI61122.1 hypothetical protein [Lachnospiraceae bacterium]